MASITDVKRELEHNSSRGSIPMSELRALSPADRKDLCDWLTDEDTRGVSKRDRSKDMPTTDAK